MLPRFAFASAIAAAAAFSNAAHAGPRVSTITKKTVVHAETCHAPVRGDLHRVHHSPLLDYSLSSYDTPRYVHHNRYPNRVTRTITTVTRSGHAPSRFVDHDRRFGAAVRHASPYRDVRREHTYINHKPNANFGVSVSIGNAYPSYGHRYGHSRYSKHPTYKRTYGHSYSRGHGYSPYRHGAKRYVKHPSRKSFGHHQRLQHAPRHLSHRHSGFSSRRGVHSRSHFRSGHRSIHHGSRRHR
ncbi:MAG: hypothetical protein AAF138_06685 [Planctomycetota bacterium]